MSLGNDAVAVATSGSLVAVGDDRFQQVSGLLEAAEGKVITAVAAGSSFALAVTAQGTVLGAGKDTDHQVSGLIEAAKGHHVTAVAVDGKTSVALTDDGTLLAAGAGADRVLEAIGGERIAAVSGGAGFFLALTRAGAILGAGNDGSQQISGIRAAAQGKRVTSVAAGVNESLAVTDEKTLLISWDLPPILAQIAALTAGRRVADACSGGDFALAALDDGTLIATGRDDGVRAILTAAAGGTKITRLASNTGATWALTPEGTLLAAGRDGYEHIPALLDATAGRQVSTASASGYLALAVIREPDRGCGPLEPGQICASFTVAPDPHDVHVLSFKVGGDHRELTSGAPCAALDTRDTEATHLIVRRASTSQDVATGSAYFTHDSATGTVDIDPDKSQLPHGLTHRRTDGNRFAFTWTT
ncbi:hypothetical protein [Embleya scabrispora]|uniref:hypothetical protein n=1 Tax=Embleya scabrispora TaxID=159449 RepID=UPI00039FF2D4|nr:hypothetical protein [Embleya scabrispora]MYS80723.1 hypothetical protein [Streptomyces sp. SID5474]